MTTWGSDLTGDSLYRHWEPYMVVIVGTQVSSTSGLQKTQQYVYEAEEDKDRKHSPTGSRDAPGSENEPGVLPFSMV